VNKSELKKKKKKISIFEDNSTLCFRIIFFFFMILITRFKHENIILCNREGRKGCWLKLINNTSFFQINYTSIFSCPVIGPFKANNSMIINRSQNVVIIYNKFKGGIVAVSIDILRSTARSFRKKR
jgi:hypothetical protein